jgi:hypothetical protein
LMSCVKEPLSSFDTTEGIYDAAPRNCPYYCYYNRIHFENIELYVTQSR